MGVNLSNKKIKKKIPACREAVKKLKGCNDKLDTQLCSLYDVLKGKYPKEKMYTPLANYVARNYEWCDRYETLIQKLESAAASLADWK